VGRAVPRIRPGTLVNVAAVGSEQDNPNKDPSSRLVKIRVLPGRPPKPPFTG
jgi:hypothetical protein